MAPPRPPSAPADDALRARFDDAARPAPGDDEIDWYVARLPRDAGTCLDAMCGSGRLLVPLVLRGIAMQGADASAAALALAAARLASAGAHRAALPAGASLAQPAHALRRGDPRRRGVPAHHRSGRRRALALERVRAHLIAPGLLIVDARVPA